MEIRYAVHPDHGAAMDTQTLRSHFLVRALFESDTLKLVYSHDDRLIIGGISPAAPVALEADKSVIGAAFFLERREIGIINVGGAGSVTVDGSPYAMAPRDGLYIGQGAKTVLFNSDIPADPAKFYFNSTPAHRPLPAGKVSFDDISPDNLGDPDNCNTRQIRKYFHPEGIETCQLVMGMTTLLPGNVWNTMPPHTHGRRMEAYFYFDMNPDQMVFHLMGRPSETRHIVVRNEEAVLSPSWSIHSGAGTRNYTFIWGMAGENQTFTDMDHVAMSQLR